MIRARTFATAATLLLGTSLVCMADTKLNLNTGLWEVTSSGETTGMPPVPPEALARMTPEQRAQFQAQIQQSLAAANKPDVSRSCITEKTLEKGLDFKKAEQANCDKKVVQSTSSVMEVQMQCTGAQKMNGTFRFEATDKQTMRGTINMTMTDGNNTMTMKRTMQGKWLGSDCGTVKPMEE